MRNLSVLCLLAALAATPLTAATPVATQVEAFAAKLPAGGIIAAEFDASSVRYAAAGAFAPQPGLAPGQVVVEIGSLTKVFTALLLAETVAEGRAALTDPIARFLPADLKLDPKVAAITLEQLATHTSGLPRMPDNFSPDDPADPYADYSVRRLYAFLRGLHPDQPAPQPADYSNVGMGLLGHLLERIHGRPYAQLVEERIARPLGLADTVVELDAGQRARLATPHAGTQRVSPWRFDALAGAGALRSTAADLARFGQALLAPGDGPLQRAWQLVRQPRAPFGASRIGLAIIIDEIDGATMYGHNGGTGGFRTLFQLDPAAGRGVVLLINNDAIEPAALLAAARPRTAAAAAAEVALGAEQLADYTGVYAIDRHARFTILAGPDGRLVVRLSGQPFLPVFPRGDDRFFYRAVEAELEFGRDARGRVDRLTLHQNGRKIPARRTADPLPVIVFATDAQLAPYAGRYRLGRKAEFEIGVHEGQLYAQLTGQQPLPVFQDRADHFVYDVVEAALTFERDASGRVVALVLHQNGADQRATRIE